MARESFDKEIQFLRLLALAGGAYSRQQFADRLGISVHNYDKTIRRLKDIVQTVHRQLPHEQSAEFAETLLSRPYDSADPLLLFLYRAKSLKESEIHRLPLLLGAMKDGPRTALELLEAVWRDWPQELAPPDEKTVRSDLRYLQEVGVAGREPGGRPQRYRLMTGFLEALTDDERLDLYDFVDIMANTQVPSVQGYLLRDNLKKSLTLPQGDADSPDSPLVPLTEPFAYRYHYPSRILDEAHLYPLVHAIRRRCYVSFLYYSPKSNRSYGAQNTNPLFARESERRRELALPLRIVYDHQYGRWYMLGFTSKRDIAKYRLEGITQLNEEKPADEQEYAERLARLDERTRTSWLIDTGRPVVVRARFYSPRLPQRDFIRERVLLQGQWGTIIEENELSFVYEIVVNGITEIKPWLRSFGSSCEVLEPRQLRREMIEEWREIAAYYESV